MRNTLALLALFSLFLLATSQQVIKCAYAPRLTFCNQINYQILDITAKEAEKTDKALSEEFRKIIEKNPTYTGRCLDIIKRTMCATHFLKCVEVDGVARVLGLCNVEMCYPHARECMKADPVA